jgi:DNA-binding transcriptional LysR family regulator
MVPFMAISARQIEAFRAVMLTGGVTTASQMLNITQPAVSRLLRDLETSIGMGLFERRGNQVIPTQDAVSLLSEVERSFVGLGQIAAFAEALRTQTAGSLRIAAMPALAAGAVTRFAAGFLRTRPNLHVSIAGMPSHLIVDAVASGQVDLGYADGPLDRPGFVVETVTVPAVVAVPEAHVLARKKVIAPRDLAGERFIGLGQGTFFRSQIDAALADVPRLVLVETPLSHVACVLVAEGTGVSIVDPYSALEFVGRGLVIKPFRVSLDAGFIALRSRQRPLSALADTFAAEFAFHIRALMRPYAAQTGRGH